MLSKMMRTLLAGLAIATLTMPAGGQPPERGPVTVVSDQDAVAMAEVRALGTAGRMMELEMVATESLNNVAAGRADRFVWLAAIPGVTPTVKILSGEVMVRMADGTFEGPFAYGEETSWGTTDRLLGSAVTTAADRFRQVDLFRTRLPLTRAVTRVVGTGAEAERHTGTLHVRRLRLEVDLGARADEGQVVQELDPYTMRLLGGQVANAPQLPLTFRPLDPIARLDELTVWNQTLADAEADGLLLLAEVPVGGLHRIGMEELVAAGVQPESIPVDRLRVLVGGTEVPVMTSDVRNNRLLGSSFIYFHVPEDPTDRKPFLPVWVMLARPGQQPLRGVMTNNAARPDVAATDTPTNLGVRIFEPNVYDNLLPTSGPQLKWATAEIRGVRHEDFDFNLADTDTAREGSVTVWATTLQSTHNARMTTWINGVQVGEGPLRGRRVEHMTYTIPAGLLVRGLNRLSIRSEEGEERGGRSIGFIQADITVPSGPLGHLPNHTITAVAAKGEPIWFRAPQITDRHVMAEISDPLRPVFAEMRRESQDGRTYMAGGLVATVDSPRLVQAPAQGLKRPALHTVAAPTFFLSDAPVDYLVVHHESLRAGLEPLLAHRSKDRIVETVGVNDLYRAFSYGEVSYQAIHQALQHALASRGGAPLTQVLLVGEGSEYWWEHRRHSPDVTQNLMPIYGWGNPGEQVRGDDAFTHLAGKGPIADVEIGRLSVNDNAELRVVVNKILQYELAPPLGNWISNHLVVMDDEPEFLRVAREIIGKSFRGANVPSLMALQWFPYEDYFRGFWRKRSVVVTDRLLDRWNAGAGTITYLGHGGPNLWSGERILHTRDLERMDTGGRMPILVAGSCDTGWIDYPVEPVRSSLAELMQRSEHGGTVASYIPISGTSSFEHNFLLTEFFRAYFDLPESTIGEITLLSKLNYHLFRNNNSVTRQFLLMGDPGTRPLRVAQAGEFRPLPVVLSATTGSLPFEATVPGMADGVADVVMMSETWEEVARARLRVAGERLSGRLQLPALLEPGTYHLVYTAENPKENQATRGATTVTVQWPDVTVAWSSDPPADEPHEAGLPITLAYEVRNGTQAPLRGATVELFDEERGEKLATHGLNLGSGDATTRKFEIPMPAGVNGIRADLFLPGPEGAVRTPLATGRIVLRGLPHEANARGAIVSFSLGDIEFTRGQRSTLLLPIYRMAEAPFASLQATLRRDSIDGPRIAPFAPLTELVSEDSTVLSFSTNETLAAGPQPLVLEIIQDTVDTSSTLQLIPFVADLGRAPDLEIVDGKVIVEDLVPQGGKTVFFRFTVRNRGNLPSGDVVARLFVDRAWDDTALANNAVPWEDGGRVGALAPGEQRDVRIRWDHQGSHGSNHQLHATVRATGGPEETDLSNNIVTLPITFQPAPNLVLTQANLRASQKFVRPYDRVMIQVPFSNESTGDFVRAFRVSVTARTLDGATRLVERRHYPRMMAGESAVMHFEWHVQPGEASLAIDVNEDREYLEVGFEDNLGQLEFEYLFGDGMFPAPGVAWDFGRLMQYGSSAGVARMPGMPGIRMALPASPNAAPQSFRFEPRFLLTGELGGRLVLDNLWGHDGKAIYLAFGETGPPLVWRFPLDPEHGVTYFEYTVHHIGAQAGSTNGNFEFRLSEFDEWQPSVPTPEPLTRMGRRENHLPYAEVHLRGPGFDSLNHLSSVEITPLMGLYTSPVVEATVFPAGPLEVVKSEPGGSRVDIEVRYGAGDRSGVDWSAWTGVTPGQSAPAPAPGVSFFQWRARLVEAADGKPTLDTVRFLINPGKPSPPER